MYPFQVATIFTVSPLKFLCISIRSRLCHKLSTVSSIWKPKWLLAGSIYR